MPIKSLKILNYVGIVVCFSIIILFIHSEIGNHCHVEDDHKEYDYCNLISNTLQPNQDRHQKLLFFIPEIHSTTTMTLLQDNSLEINSGESFSILNASRILLLSTLLIWKPSFHQNTFLNKIRGSELIFTTDPYDAFIFLFIL